MPLNCKSFYLAHKHSKSTARQGEKFIERIIGAEAGDIIIGGSNFGCGGSGEQTSVGLDYTGVQAVICKSVNRIFYRSAVNQGLPIIILPEAVDAYEPADEVNVNFSKGTVTVGTKTFTFAPLPEK